MIVTPSLVSIPNLHGSWVFLPTLAYVITSWSNPFIRMPPSTNAHASPAPVLSSSPQAYVVMPETIGDNAWYPDSSATHHLTHSITSMGESAPYSVPSKLYVGNGSTLPILSTSQLSSITRVTARFSVV